MTIILHGNQYCLHVFCVIFFGLIGLVVARIMTRYLFGLLIFLFYRLSAQTDIA